MKKTLIFGYGNPDRQDDGVAWHVLVSLAIRLGQTPPGSVNEEFLLLGGTPDLFYDLQLTPEFSETIAGYERVCFVDAHTGEIPEDIHLTSVIGEYQASPFTHHLTPASCLALAQTLYHKDIEAILVSVRGYAFGFTNMLSNRTQSLVLPAVEKIWDWLNA